MSLRAFSPGDSQQEKLATIAEVKRGQYAGASEALACGAGLNFGLFLH